MIDVKAAVAAAESYLGSFPRLLPPTSARLEETEIDEQTGDWLITISYAVEPAPHASNYPAFSAATTKLSITLFEPACSNSISSLSLSTPTTSP